jgi:hypothetical protein
MYANACTHLSRLHGPAHQKLLLNISILYRKDRRQEKAHVLFKIEGITDVLIYSFL